MFKGRPVFSRARLSILLLCKLLGSIAHSMRITNAPQGGGRIDLPGVPDDKGFYSRPETGITLRVSEAA